MYYVGNSDKDCSEEIKSHLGMYVSAMKEDMLNNSKKSGFAPIANAYVFPEGIEGAALMSNNYKKCFDKTGQIFETFSNKKNAIAWANQCLQEC